MSLFGLRMWHTLCRICHPPKPNETPQWHTHHDRTCHPQANLQPNPKQSFAIARANELEIAADAIAHRCFTEVWASVAGAGRVDAASEGGMHRVVCAGWITDVVHGFAIVRLSVSGEIFMLLTILNSLVAINSGNDSRNVFESV
jgi:hypothetical protein